MPDISCDAALHPPLPSPLITSGPPFDNRRAPKRAAAFARIRITAQYPMET